MIVGYFILVVVAVFIAVDVYLMGNTWQSRIKIGRVTEDAAYKNLVTNRLKAWLTKIPTVKLTDNSRLVLIDIIKGNYKRSTIQHWQKAGLILGAHDAGLLTEIEVNEWLQQTHPKEIPVEADYVIYAYALLKATSEAQKQQYKIYFDAVYKMILELNKEGNGVSYKTYTEPYKYVDTIGFICPFLTLYAKTYQVTEAFDLALDQIKRFNQHGMFPNTLLPAHVYNGQTLMHAGIYGWGRGMGWYAIGLIDMWLLLSKDSEDYRIVSRWVQDYSAEILKYQQQDGSWSWNVLVQNSRSDSSTVVMLTWFLKNAAQLPSLHDKNTRAVEKALTYLKSNTRRNGALDFCQGDTKGIGVYSQTFDILPFAQGYLLRILNTKHDEATLHH